MYYNTVNNTRWFYLKQVFEKNILVEDAKVLLIGNSRLNTNVDVKKIPDAWTFALGGSSPIEMYYTLKNYIQIYSKPDTVFISFSPQAFIEDYSFWIYAVRNNYLNYNEFEEVYSDLKTFPTEKVLGNFPYLQYGLYKLNYIEYYQADLYKNHVFLAKRKNENIIQHFQMEKGGWNYPGLKNGCSALNYETSLKSFDVSALLNLYLIKIFDLCRKENIHIIFDYMPINESSYKNLNENFVLEYKSYIGRLNQKYPDFTISDTIYYYNNKYFGDESHMNAKGKQKFTKYLLDKYFN